MARSRKTARDRNKELREQQRRISEERRQRVLKTEDFNRASVGEERVRFRSMEEGPRPYPEERRTGRPVDATGNRKRAKAKRTSKRPVKTKEPRAAAVPLKERLAQRPRIEKIPTMIKHEYAFSIVACIILLSFIGLIMVTSSSYFYSYNEHDGNSFFLATKHLKFLLGGLVILIAVSRLPIQWFKNLSTLAYLGSIVLLLAVFAFGRDYNGSKRWLDLGPISFQPSEVAKLGTALYVAAKAEQWRDRIKEGRTFFKLFLIILLPTFLVGFQNLSSGLIIFMIGLGIMLVAGCRFRHFLFIVVPVVLLVFFFLVLPLIVPIEKMPGFMRWMLERFLYRTNRIKAYLDPFAYAQGTGYQTVQSLYAVGSGGFFGSGLGESMQKLGFIPEAYNDIIFSIICEELGLFGATIVSLLFGMLIYNGFKISEKAPDRFTTYVAAGITAQIGIQAILNMAVNTNLIPNTGVALPFISYGGTSLFFLMAGMGILLNISRYTGQQMEDTEAAMEDPEAAEPTLEDEFGMGTEL